jgi:hypothetical protein
MIVGQHGRARILTHPAEVAVAPQLFRFGAGRVSFSVVLGCCFAYFSVTISPVFELR